MKHLLLVSLFILSSCAQKTKAPVKESCLLVYDLKQDKFIEVQNQQYCEVQLPACSTFKVPLAVMGFDSGVLKDEDEPVFTWNKEKSVIEPWNKDHTPASWMRDSVVWVSQAMTPKIGATKIQKYLDAFDYGNKDFSGGVKYAWLTPAPFINEPMQNSLQISGYEQVEFLKKLWQKNLKATLTSQELTQKIMTHDTSPRGAVLTGKTGSGFADSKFDLRLGWFVGHLKTDKSEFIVVSNFSDKQKQTEVTYGGREAKEMALKFLTDNGYW